MSMKKINEVRFEFVTRVLCVFEGKHIDECQEHVCGFWSATAEDAQSSALEQARRNGWLQIGDDMFCPTCASKRQLLAAVEKAREGQWIPWMGLRVRCARRSADGVPEGQLLSVAENLILEGFYTIADVRFANEHVMVSFDGKPGHYYNARLFEPIGLKEEAGK